MTWAIRATFWISVGRSNSPVPYPCPPGLLLLLLPAQGLNKRGAPQDAFIRGVAFPPAP